MTNNPTALHISTQPCIFPHSHGLAVILPQVPLCLRGWQSMPAYLQAPPVQVALLVCPCCGIGTSVISDGECTVVWGIPGCLTVCSIGWGRSPMGGVVSCCHGQGIGGGQGCGCHNGGDSCDQRCNIQCVVT